MLLLLKYLKYLITCCSKTCCKSKMLNDAEHKMKLMRNEKKKIHEKRGIYIFDDLAILGNYV